MLQKTYRFSYKNATGVAFGATDDVVIKARRWNFNSSGAFTPESAEAILTTAGAGNSLANNGWINCITQDNTTVGWFGGEFLVTATVSTATPNGNVEIWMDFSTDGGTTWNDNGSSRFITALKFTVTGTQHKSFELD